MTTAGAPVRLDGDVVMVTGGGRGLGRAYARALAGRGALVVVTDIDAEAAQEVAEQIAESGGSAAALVGDVVADAGRLMGQCLDVFGRLDVLVNNAGVAFSAPFEQTTVDDVERLVRVHTMGTVATTSAAWRALRSSRGRVINVTSGALFGLPGSVAYATAKAGILGFTTALASERDRSGVTVNAVMPMARTGMYEAAGGVVGSDEDRLITSHFPADAVSPVVVYLAWRDVPHNGEIFEVAGTAVSRIVFASGPIVEVRSPEDMASTRDALRGPSLEPIGSLAESVGRKLAFAMESTSDKDAGTVV